MSAMFAAALLDPHARVPGLRTWNGSDPSVRLDVYRNNVVGSLVDALAETFPVVRALVGDAMFRAAAAAHVRTHPPRCAMLAMYGQDFAGWLAGFEPLRALPYLPDMARLEHARVHAFHAADAVPIAPGALAAAIDSPGQLPRMGLRLHPAVQVLSSPWAVVSLWAAHQGRGRIEDVQIGHAESALVLRSADDAVVVPVAPATARWVERIRQGASLGRAVTEAGEGLDLGASLALLLRLDALTGLLPDCGDLHR